MSKADEALNSENHPLRELIRQMYSARELITAAYERSGTGLSDAERLKVEPLIKAHLLRRDGIDGVRLNQRLQKVFDGALRKNKIAAISTDLSSELSAAEMAMHHMLDAEAHARFDLAHQYREEVEIHLLTIYDMLDDSSLAIYHRVTSSYGMQGSPELRKRENELYMAQLSSLIKSFTEVRTALQDEPFTADADIQSFIINFDIHCMEVVDRIRTTQNTIRDHLFRVRQLEERGRKIRAVADYLRRHPGFDAPTLPGLMENATFFKRIVPQRISGYANLGDTQTDEACAELVRSISERIGVEAPKADRAPSKLVSREQEEVVQTPTESDLLVKELLSECFLSGAPVSARQYWASAKKGPEASQWPEVEWLFILATYMDSDPHTANGQTSEFAKIVFRTVGEHSLSGTHDLLDIVVYPARMDPQEAIALVETSERETSWA